jgi:hypothetical protein
LREAMNVLTEPMRRASYDRSIGHEPPEPPAALGEPPPTFVTAPASERVTSAVVVPTAAIEAPVTAGDAAAAPEEPPAGAVPGAAVADAGPPPAEPTAAAPPPVAPPEPVASPGVPAAVPSMPQLGPETEYNGELLRQVREARGLTLHKLADKTRISRSHLENVEADRYERLPATVYLRGILVSLARELKLDPGSVTRSYLALVDTRARGAGR